MTEVACQSRLANIQNTFNLFFLSSSSAVFQHTLTNIVLFLYIMCEWDDFLSDDYDPRGRQERKFQVVNSVFASYATLWLCTTTNL